MEDTTKNYASRKLCEETNFGTFRSDSVSDETVALVLTRLSNMNFVGACVRKLSAGIVFWYLSVRPGAYSEGLALHH
jgi:hypothetical protein